MLNVLSLRRMKASGLNFKRCENLNGAEKKTQFEHSFCVMRYAASITRSTEKKYVSTIDIMSNTEESDKNKHATTECDPIVKEKFFG